MIEAEFQKSPEGAHEYRATARLVVRDDGSHQAWDPDGVIPWGIHALRSSAESGRGLEQVFFESEPVEWVRRLNTILRTGYLVPVIVRDDEPTYRRASGGRDGEEPV